MATSEQENDYQTGDLAYVNPPSPISEDDFQRCAFAHEKVHSEWVDGKVEIMAPVTIDHSRTSGFLLCILGGFIEQRRVGHLLGLGFMIRLGGAKSRRLPDLLFVCNDRLDLIQDRYLDGPPDLVVEVVSEDTQSRDYRVKYLEYEAAGVREYWIVDPLAQRFEAYRLGDDGKFASIRAQDGKFYSAVLAGFYIRNEWLWATPRPKVRDVLEELGVD